MDEMIIIKPLKKYIDFIASLSFQEVFILAFWYGLLALIIIFIEKIWMN